MNTSRIALTNWQGKLWIWSHFENKMTDPLQDHPRKIKKRIQPTGFCNSCDKPLPEKTELGHFKKVYCNDYCNRKAWGKRCLQEEQREILKHKLMQNI